jgi:RIO-like serine/threonine protein kinase
MHADVRMDNIVVSETGEASLIDFSHARTRWCPGPLFCEELRENSIF